MTRTLLAPRWVGLHVLTVVLTVVLIRIGAWQWGRGQETGRIQNYGYGVEWWFFAAFTVFMWGKLVLDEVRPERAPEARPAREVPTPAPIVYDDADEEDRELAAYNRHLAWLNSNPRS